MKQLISGQRRRLSTRSGPKELGALSGTQGMHAEMPSFRTNQAGGGGERVRGGWGLGILLFFFFFPHLTKLPAFSRVQETTVRQKPKPPSGDDIVEEKEEGKRKKSVTAQTCNVYTSTRYIQYFRLN